jgi:hypothetical protein
MGIGYVLGGVAKGLQAQDELAQKQQVADAAAQMDATKIGLAAQSLSVKQQALQDSQDRNLQTQVNKHIADVTKLVTEIIKNGQTSGTAPDKLMNAVAPLLDDIDAWGARVGQDTSKIRASIVATVQNPTTAPVKVGQTLEQIKADLAAGKKLTPSQQKLYDDSLHADFLSSLLTPDATGEGAPAPAAAPAPLETPAPAPAPAPVAAPGGEVPVRSVKTQAISAPPPPVPPALASKPGLAWSPSRQKFYDAQGNAYNQQGVPVNP